MPPSAPSAQSAGDPSGHQRVLDAFRGTSNRAPRLHPREKLILGIVAVHLGFLAWAYGGRNFWAQYASLALGALSFVLALLPREIPRTVDSPGMTLIPWFTLRRSALFWGGCVVLALVGVQGANPAWVYHLEGKEWTMPGQPFVGWLPRGVGIPWSQPGGPWHTTVIWASAWLTACSVRIGLTRRRSLRILLVTVVANGIGIAALGIAQRLIGNGRIYWTMVSPNDSFFSSFVYKNFAGTWLNLTLAAAVGLAGWHYLRGLRRMEKSNPSGVFTFLAALLAVSVFISFARGAALMMMIYLGLAVAVFVLHQFSIPKELRRPAVALVMLGLMGFCLKLGLDSLQADFAWSRISSALTPGDGSLKDRQTLTQAALRMLGDHWLWGTGAGSFRYLFADYQQWFPEIWFYNNGRLYWEHAHNDIVEFTLELGLPGVLAVLAMAGAGVVALIRSYFWENPVSLALVLALALTLVHAWWEFVFQCPAILVLWSVLAVVAVQWAEIEEGG
jgi:Ca2+/Na+ antiporter